MKFSSTSFARNRTWWLAPTSVALWLIAPNLFAATLAVDNQNPGCSDVTGMPYCSVGAAVAAAQPGDVIVVAAGIYPESQIVIDKSLTIVGHGADNTVIDGGGGTGLDSAGLVQITANGPVVFTGFTVQDAAADSSGVRVAIVAGSGTPGVRYQIVGNRIVGSNDPAEADDYGFYSYGGLDDLNFKGNVVTGTGANAVLIEKHAGPTDVSNNVLDAGVYGTDPIFTFTYGGVDITTPQTRDGNLIDLGTGGPPFTGYNRATGITFAGAFDGADLGDGRFTHIDIRGNTILNIMDERRGISLWNDAAGDGSGGEISGVKIMKNVFVGASGGSGTKGIQLLGLVTDTKIVNNGFEKLETGVHLRHWKDSDPAGTKIVSNRFRSVGSPVSAAAGASNTKNHADHVSP